jgi:hypothetical protein
MTRIDNTSVSFRKIARFFVRRRGAHRSRRYLADLEPLRPRGARAPNQSFPTMRSRSAGCRNARTPPY